MNIREWYGINGEYDKTLDINTCVDGLLEMYSEAIMEYFSVANAANYQSIENISTTNLNQGQILFLNWLKEKGFPYLKELAAKHLPNNEQLISKIEYDKYILEEEMDFQFPDDVRSCLISIVEDVPEYIQAANEVSVSVSVDENWDSWSIWLTESQISGLELFISDTNHYELKGNSYIVSNYKESAVNAGSLFVRRAVVPCAEYLH